MTKILLYFSFFVLGVVLGVGAVFFAYQGRGGDQTEEIRSIQFQVSEIDTKLFEIDKRIEIIQGILEFAYPVFRPAK